MRRMLLVTIISLFIGAPAFAGGLAPSLEALVSEARRDGLPVRPLQLKAREGLAKGIPVERIEAVLRDMSAQYERARDLVPDASPDELEGVAAAMRSGASDEAILALASLDPGVRGAALHGLADLVQLQIDDVHAVRLVLSASRRGPAGLTGLASATATLVQAGSTPGEAARVVGLAVSQGRDPFILTPPGHGQQGSSPPPHSSTNGPPDHSNSNRPPHAGLPGHGANGPNGNNGNNGGKGGGR